MRRSLNLTSKVTLAFVLFATALAVIIGLLAYANGRNTLEAATFSDLLSAAIEKEASFEGWVTEGQTRIASVVASPFIQMRVAALRAETDPEAVLTLHDEIVAELKPLIGEDRLFINLAVLDPESGQVLAATNPNEEGKFKEDRPYFINGQKGSYVQNVHFALECECPAMTASAPIVLSDGTLVAVLAGQLNLEEMGAIINRGTEIRQSFDAYLVNTANLLVTQPRLIADSAVLQRGVRTEATQECLVGNSGTTVSDDYRGVQVMAVYRWLPARDLCLVVKVDQSEALQPVRTFGRTLLVIALITLLAASIVAVALARTITRPVLALKESVTRFGQGQLETRFPEQSKDELGALGHEFNAMADAIVEKETLLQNHAKDLEQRVAERTERLSFLADASQALSESFEYLERLKRLAALTVPKIADWCSVDILNDDGTLQRLAVVHVDPQKVAFAYDLHRRFPGDPKAPTHVLQTGKSVFVREITEEMLVGATNDETEEVVSIIRELGLRSSITVPLLVNGRPLGVIAFIMAESGRLFDEDDLTLAEDLARRAALLIDNSKLYYETQKINAELEQRVAERTAHLTAVNRELEAFSYSVSHDLRAPLRAVDGFSQALLEDYNDNLDSIGQDFLRRIRTESQRMGQLIDDLIGLSRFTRTEMNLADVNLSQIAREITAELARMEPDRVVEISIQDHLEVWADKQLMRVVLQNLISNAWKFTSKKPKAHIEFGSINTDDEIEYYVRDNGAGFDMAYVNKLFGAFQRLHAMTEFSGTGIGLAIVQRVIHRHGGAIRAVGTLNEGAAFYFTLGAINRDGGPEIDELYTVG